MSLSIIIPVLNEAESLEHFLLPLQKFRNENCEIIIVDGGSQDKTSDIAQNFSDHFFVSEGGRAKQMNAGAKCAQNSILLFLHADTVLPDNFLSLISEKCQSHTRCWGRFNVRLSGKQFIFRIIERLMNLRSCLTGIATGDQAIFVNRKSFEAIDGFPAIPLMEDIALSKKLKSLSRPMCITEPVVTSSRRWEQYGVWRTIFLMWQLRLAYFFGADPILLKKKYS